MEDELANMHLANEDEEAFHEDLKVVIKGMPWFFNNHLLLPHNLQSGEDPVQLPLNNAIFWIQIHDFPPVLMLETMARRFGSFFRRIYGVRYRFSFIGVVAVYEDKDITLRDPTRRGPVGVSRWLREPDGTRGQTMYKEKESSWRNHVDILGNFDPIPNFKISVTDGGYSRELMEILRLELGLEVLSPMWLGLWN
ncbi:hypothetical protein Godav_023347 [Gossypium davidsonii]|uniref:DUF4283 domain-containing protein n=2 Tax=Gossypium TaxID=3633 RepID=A0A7J8SRA9_GOSDV|nr:hypothetical protein [Gossypium davidsonii]MBA0664358.1 hypothetical protein [Gossypium klotzschianum]